MFMKWNCKNRAGVRKESAEGEPQGAARFLLTFSFYPPVVHPFARRRRSSEKETGENHTIKNNKLTQAYYNKEQKS